MHTKIALIASAILSSLMALGSASHVVHEHIQTKIEAEQ